MLSITDIAIEKIKEISNAEGIGYYSIRVKIIGGGCAGYSYDIHFDDLTVRGRRQSPLGFTTAVESDKTTPSLIDYRTDYRDRLSQMEEGR